MMPENLLTQQNILLLAGVLLILVVLAAVFSKKHLAYKKVDLFTYPEKRFFHALDNAVGHRYRVLGKCRIADIIMPQDGLSKKDWNRLFWNVSSKHFDFVIIEPDSLDVVAVVELNDSSHEKKDRVQRDKLVNAACGNAGLPLVWVKARNSYDIAALWEHIEDSLDSYRPRKSNK